jgi:hypothetical protein
MTGVTALAALAGILGTGAALAQGSGIPIERDLRRSNAIDRNLGIERPVETGPGRTPGNPSGVAGFDGPPGFAGDSVSNNGPLPPGAPGNEN